MVRSVPHLRGHPAILAIGGMWSQYCFPSQGSFMINKRQLIDDIRRYNPTAQPRFLSQFDEESLKQYLLNLEGAHLKRTQSPNYIRPDSNLRMVS
jgi:hypothetical protein